LPELGKKVYYGPVSEKQNATGETFLFKNEIICGKIIVRPRAEGDKVFLGAQAMGKSLKKIFIDRKIPASKRSLVPVFADEEGLIAVSGLGKNTKRFPLGGENCAIIITQMKEKE
jgi:tRNA(Ile)-lysidine synthase